MHGCRFAQVLNHVLDFAERHQVPQRFLSRKQPNGFAAVFRLIRSEEFGRLESRRKKMKVVHQRVIHVRCGQYRRHLRLPNAFCEPRTGWPLAEMLLEVRRKPFDLFALVFGRNHRQDWLIKSSAHHFCLLLLHQ